MNTKSIFARLFHRRASLLQRVHFANLFVILTTARSGSNALVGALNQHEKIFCDYEIFHYDAIYTAGPNPFSIEQRNRDPVGFLHQCAEWRSAEFPERAAYGFKLFLNHNRTLLDHVAMSKDWFPVILKRKNLLDQWISKKIAHQTGAWTAFEKGNRATKVRFQPDEFLKFKREMESGYRAVESLLRKKEKKWVAMHYETLESDMQEMCERLGLSGGWGAFVHRKQNPTSTSEKIDNPDDALQFLDQTGMLDYWNP